MNRRDFLFGCCIAVLLSASTATPAAVFAEDTVPLTVANLTGNRIVFGIATVERAEKGKWTRITINPRQSGMVRLESPDDFVVRVEYGSGAYTSEPMALKKFIREHPGFVLQLTAELEQLSEGTPGQGNKPKYRTVLKASAKRPGSNSQDSLNMTLYRN